MQTKQQHIGSALKLLSLMADSFLPGCPAALPGMEPCLDISADPDFWFIIQSALVSDCLPILT